MRARILVVVLSVGSVLAPFAIVGCTGPGAAPPLVVDGGVLHFDGAMISGRDTGPPPEIDGGGGDLPPAVISPDGVLTPFPHIRVSVTPAEFQLASLNFVIEHDGDSRGPLLTMYAELRNIGTAVECGFTPDVFLDGLEIVTLVEAEAFYERYSSGTLSTVTRDCIAPGAIGVMEGVQRGIDESTLASASFLSIDARPLRVGSTYLRADDPALSIEVTSTADGWILSGMMTPSRTIRNYGFRAYPRDARGLLFAELLAFPGELATLPAYVPQVLATDAATRSFTDYVAYQSWITE